MVKRQQKYQMQDIVLVNAYFMLFHILLFHILFYIPYFIIPYFIPYFYFIF